jgi:hypothetical protein
LLTERAPPRAARRGCRALGTPAAKRSSSDRTTVGRGGQVERRCGAAVVSEHITEQGEPERMSVRQCYRAVVQRLVRAM